MSVERKEKVELVNIDKDSSTPPKYSNYADCLKAFTIFCVVWAHCVSAFIGGRFNVLDNYLNLYLSAFHMPLFMLISGYFVYYSESRYSIKQFVIRKCKTVLLPLVLWNTLFYIALKTGSIILNGEITAPDLLKGYISYLTSGLWYLTALFASSIILVVTNAIFKKDVVRITAYVLIIIITHLFTLPAYTAFMFPFCCVGYLLNKYSVFEAFRKLSKRKKVAFVCIIFTATAALCVVWRMNYTVYESGTNVWNGSVGDNVMAYFIRFAIGLFCSASLYVVTRALFSRIENNRIIPYITYAGKHTLEIYILHSFLVSVLFRKALMATITSYVIVDHMLLLNFVIGPITAVLFILLSLAVTASLNKIPGIKNFIFGLRSNGK